MSIYCTRSALLALAQQLRLGESHSSITRIDPDDLNFENQFSVMGAVGRCTDDRTDCFLQDKKWHEGGRQISDV